jgi:hypothetical protein
MSRQQKGVALILVLMVTGVLGLLVLQISLTAREHTDRAQRLIDRANADLRARSATAALLFSLATHEWGAAADPDNSDPYASQWRFDGAAFKVADAELQIQDFGGLLPVPQPGGSPQGFERALAQAGVSEGQSRVLIEQIAAIQSAPAYVPLQHFQEFALLGGLDRDTLQRLEAMSTLYPSRYFNPATAPDTALAARFSGSTLTGLRTLRENRRLDSVRYFSLTGEGGDESISFLPGPGFRIRTLVRVGEVTAAEELSATIDPYAADPFRVWSRRRPEFPVDLP